MSLSRGPFKNADMVVCQSHTHHALVQAVPHGEERLSEELMRSHLVGLNSALDVRDRPSPARSPGRFWGIKRAASTRSRRKGVGISGCQPSGAVPPTGGCSEVGFEI